MKKLIVNADDFGLTHEINQGIIQAYQRGILTSASLVASGEAFDDAVTLALKFPKLDIGVHLTLIEERPVLPPGEIPSIVNADGCFYKKASHFIHDYLLNKINAEEVYRELQAQIRKIRQSGLFISHIDSHQHIHMLPRILSIVMQLVDEFEIKAVRLPIEQIKFDFLLCIHKWPRLIKQLGFNFLAYKARSYLKGHTTDHFFGFFDSGHLNIRRLERIISQLPIGISEMMCHPALDGGITIKKYAHWKYNWLEEYRCLMHSPILDLLSRQKVILTSFRSM